MESLAKATGEVHFELRDKHGNIKEKGVHKNLVVTAGKNWVADQLSAQNKAQMSHMAIGTGTTAAVAGDTTLETELDRNALTSTTLSGNTVTYVAEWAAGDGTGGITEAGLFNSGSAGDMLCRSVFAIKNKGATDALTLTWILTISAA